jgi:hypothetical protein
VEGGIEDALVKTKSRRSEAVMIRNAKKIQGAGQLKSSRERIFDRTMRGRMKCVIISLLMAEQSVDDSTMNVTATGIQLRRRDCPKLLYRRHGTLPDGYLS